MKKYLNYIIAFVLTVVCLSATSFLWKTKKIVLQFDVKAEAPFAIQVFYTSSEQQSFQEPQSVKKEILVSTPSVKVDMYTHKIAKLKINFSKIQNKISLSNMRLVGRNTVPLKFSDFQFEKDVRVSKEGNELEISSKKSVLSYKPVVNVYAKKRIDSCIFIILTCLFFFSFYKVWMFLTEMNKLEKVSWINICFVVFFFLFLFIPMLKISDAEKSEQENRMLAKFPQGMDGNNLNTKFGIQFDSWFSDRFFGRTLFLNLYTYLKLQTSYVYCQGNDCLGKDGWVVVPFIKGNHPKLMDEEIKNYQQSFEKLGAFCIENNMICYFLPVPDRSRFYPRSYQKKDYVGLKDLLKQVFSEVEGIKVIDPTERLWEANKKDFVFFATDHHWTDWGAFQGLQAISEDLILHDIHMDVRDDIFRTYHNNQVRAEFGRDFGIGAFCKKLNLSESFCPLKYTYKYYDFEESDISRENNQKTLNAIFSNPKASNETLVIIGNSMAENISPLFVPYFKKIYKYRSNSFHEDNLKMKRWEKDLLEIKPQVLLFVVGEAGFKHFNDMWEK